MDTSKVNRVEVIDHTPPKEGDRAFVKGRVFTFWEKEAHVEAVLQDDGRTLKIFITK